MCVIQQQNDQSQVLYFSSTQPAISLPLLPAHYKIRGRVLWISTQLISLIQPVVFRMNEKKDQITVCFKFFPFNRHGILQDLNITY